MPNRFIFIITYGRSGSTLLQALLNSAHGVDIRGENHGALFELYRAIRAINATAQHGAGREIDRNRPWYGANTIDADRFADDLLNAFITNVLRPTPDTEVSGFKEIRHPFKDHQILEDYFDFLISSFPNAKLIFNSREHGAVLRSTQWDIPDTNAYISELQRLDDLFASYTEKHPQHAAHMQYEMYQTQPKKIEHLFSFIGIDYNAQSINSILEERLRH